MYEQRCTCILATWGEWVVQAYTYIHRYVVSSSWLNCVTVAFSVWVSFCGQHPLRRAGSVRGVHFCFVLRFVYGVCVPVSVVVSNISAWLAIHIVSYVCMLLFGFLKSSYQNPCNPKTTTEENKTKSIVCEYENKCNRESVWLFFSLLLLSYGMGRRISNEFVMSCLNLKWKSHTIWNVNNFSRFGIISLILVNPMASELSPPSVSSLIWFFCKI